MTKAGKNTGRKNFQRYKSLIRLLNLVVRFLPRFIRGCIWDMSRPFGGHISLALRYALLKTDVKYIGENVYVGRNVTILNRENFSIGNNVSIHENCYIDAVGGCHIGNDVSIAHSCSIVSFDHTWEISDIPIKYNPIKKGAVRIADDVWIGAGVKLLSGVTVATRSVVAAGAVVTRPVAAGCIYGGVPARKISDMVQGQ